MSNEVLPPVALKHHLRKRQCQLIKQTVTSRTCGYGGKDISYRFMGETTKENVHVDSDIICKVPLAVFV